VSGPRDSPCQVDLHAAEQQFDELVAWALRELLEPGRTVAVLFEHDGHVIRARSVPVGDWGG